MLSPGGGLTEDQVEEEAKHLGKEDLKVEANQDQLMGQLRLVKEGVLYVEKKDIGRENALIKISRETRMLQTLQVSHNNRLCLLSAHKTVLENG